MYGVPWEYKDYQGQEKGLLRYAMSGYLPDEVIDVLIQYETMRIASEWNIEVVDTDE